MLLTDADLWGTLVLLLFAVGVPMQLAAAGLLTLGRRVSMLTTVGMPILILAVGLAGTVALYDEALAAVRQASDPSWVALYAIDDRARAVAPATLAGLLALLLAAPPAFGAAMASLRVAPRRWALPVVAGGVCVTAGAVLGGIAFALDVISPLLPPIVALGLVGPLAALAGVSQHKTRRSAALAGLGALLVALGGAAIAGVGLAQLDVRAAVGSFEDPFGAAGRVAELLERARVVVPPLAPAFGVALLAVGSVAASRDWRRLSPRDGLDALSVVVLTLLLTGTGAWALARRQVLSRLAGDHAAAVLAASPGYDVPHRELVPPRVLVVDDAGPRWLLLRERGGLEVAPIAEPDASLGPLLRFKDGLVLAPSLSMVDVYLAINGSDAGEVSLIGCAPASPDLRAQIADDPLVGAGRCAAFPLGLRVTRALEDPRVLIVLAERMVDDGGEVYPVAQVRDVDGRDVVIRGQMDATVADLVATLQVLGSAGRVYLGYGVDLDGEDVAVGVDPELRIREAGVEDDAEVAEGADPAEP